MDPTARDPTAEWELRRAQWLSPSTPLPPRAPLAPTSRLAALESLLHEAIQLSLGETPAPTAPDKGKARAPIQEDDLDAASPDGGFPIRALDRSQGTAVDLDRATSSILAAFRQGRELKERLPLALVTKVLYYGWIRDGTIPSDYVPVSPSVETTAAAAYYMNPPAVPHPSQPRSPSFPTPARTTFAKTPPDPAFTATGVPTLPLGASGMAQAQIVRLGKKNPLAGSGWRQDRDIESTSDCI